MYCDSNEREKPLKTNMKTETKQMTNSEFWNLKEVTDQQDIQKKNPFRSKRHVDAFYEIKRLLAFNISVEFAEEYMGEYE